VGKIIGFQRDIVFSPPNEERLPKVSYGLSLVVVAGRQRRLQDRARKDALQELVGPWDDRTDLGLSLAAHKLFGGARTKGSYTILAKYPCVATEQLTNLYHFNSNTVRSSQIYRQTLHLHKLMIGLLKMYN
jgi:hypothetical protein